MSEQQAYNALAPDAGRPRRSNQGNCVYHVVKHNGCSGKFWHGPFDSLCANCHDVDQQRVENGGKPRPALDDFGWPTWVGGLKP